RPSPPALSLPNARGEFSVRERALFDHPRVLMPTLGLRRSDNRGMDTGHAESKAQSMRNRLLHRKVADKIVTKLVKTLPVNVVIGSDRLVALFPGHISNRSFRYNAELLFPGAGQNEIDPFLVPDADRSLQGIERATLHSTTRRPPISDRLADQLFAAFIAFAGVDDIKSGIQGAFEQASHCFFGGSFKANLGPAETKDRDLHVGFARLPSFHFVNCRAFP